MTASLVGRVEADEKAASALLRRLGIGRVLIRREV